MRQTLGAFLFLLGIAVLGWVVMVFFDDSKHMGSMIRNLGELLPGLEMEESMRKRVQGALLQGELGFELLGKALILLSICGISLIGSGYALLSSAATPRRQSSDLTSASPPP